MAGEPTTAGCRAVADRAVPADADAACLAGARGGRRPDRRPDQPARAGPRRDRGQPVVRHARQPARPDPCARRLVERLCRCGGHGRGGRGLRQRHRGLHSDSRRLLRHGRTEDDVGPHPARRASGRWRPASTPSGPMARTVAGLITGMELLEPGFTWPVRTRADLVVGRLPIERIRPSPPRSTGLRWRVGVAGLDMPGLGRRDNAGRPPAGGRGLASDAAWWPRTPRGSVTACGAAGAGWLIRRGHRRAAWAVQRG